jgi:transposase-like protein
MAYNPIQFQQGMLLPEFLQSFGTEAAFAEAVRRARSPSGFVCPRSKAGAYCIVVSGRRRLYQCHACHRQTSLTAGSLFGST